MPITRRTEPARSESIWKSQRDEAYGARTMSALFLFIIVMLLLAFTLWFFWPWRVETAPLIPERLGAAATLPSADYYEQRGVIRDGVIRPVETWVTGGYMTAQDLARIAPAAGRPESPIRGAVYDADGMLIGQIDALIYEDGRVKRVNFVLAPELVPWEIGQSISLPIEDIIVSWDRTGYTIHLTRPQTAALSDALFGPPR